MRDQDRTASRHYWRIAHRNLAEGIHFGASSHRAEHYYTAQDIRFTTKGSTLYAIALGWPADGHLLIRSVDDASGFKVESVSLLGSNTRLTLLSSPMVCT